MKNLLLPFCIFLMAGTFSLAQDTETLIARGNKLQQEFKYEEALRIFESLLKNDTNNVLFMNKVSHLLSAQAYNGVGDEFKSSFYNRSKLLAEKVIRLEPDNAMGYYNLAFALGRLSNHAPVKIKVTNARQIRLAAEKAIALDPKMAGPYHIMGRWHRVIAGFNAFESAMISTFYGKGLEGGSYEEAIHHFQKAVVLEPANCFHYFEMAITYLERDQENDKERAIAWLNKTLQIKPRYSDEEIKHQKARELLKKLEEE